MQWLSICKKFRLLFDGFDGGVSWVCVCYRRLKSALPDIIIYMTCCITYDIIFCPKVLFAAHNNYHLLLLPLSVNYCCERFILLLEQQLNASYNNLNTSATHAFIYNCISSQREFPASWASSKLVIYYYLQLFKEDSAPGRASVLKIIPLLFSFFAFVWALVLPIFQSRDNNLFLYVLLLLSMVSFLRLFFRPLQDLDRWRLLVNQLRMDQWPDWMYFCYSKTSHDKFTWY